MKICQKINSVTDLGAVSFIVGSLCKTDKALSIKTTLLKVAAFAADIFLSVFFFPWGLIAEAGFFAIRLLPKKVVSACKAIAAEKARKAEEKAAEKARQQEIQRKAAADAEKASAEKIATQVRKRREETEGLLEEIKTKFIPILESVTKINDIEDFLLACKDIAYGLFPDRPDIVEKLKAFLSELTIEEIFSKATDEHPIDLYSIFNEGYGQKIILDLTDNLDQIKKISQEIIEFIGKLDDFMKNGRQASFIDPKIKSDSYRENASINDLYSITCDIYNKLEYNFIKYKVQCIEECKKRILPNLAHGLKNPGIEQSKFEFFALRLLLNIFKYQYAFSQCHNDCFDREKELILTLKTFEFMPPRPSRGGPRVLVWS